MDHIIDLKNNRQLEKIKNTLSNVSSKDMTKLQHMLEDTVKSEASYRIMPSSRIHVYWDVISIVAIMYYSIVYPIRISYFLNLKQMKSSFVWSFAFDYLFDVLFIVDMLLRIHVYAFISFETGRNEIICDKEQMKKNYLTSEWFRVDRVAVIPVELLSIWFGYYSILRISKLVRVLQIRSILSRFQKNLQESVKVTISERQVSGVFMFLFSLLIIIWSSAGWHAMREDESVYDSVYWALTTLTTVGYGDITPVNFKETCFVLAVGAIGATFAAAIIANVTSFIHDAEISESNYDHKFNCIKVSLHYADMI